MNVFSLASLLLLFTFSSFAAQWTPIGPGNIGGRIVDEVSDPAHPSLIYVAASVGGVFKSEDGGATFSPVFDSQDTLSVGALAMDPGNNSRLWVGTGDLTEAKYPGTGIFLTEDGGRSFRKMGLEQTRGIGRIVVDPTNTATVYAAAMGNAFAPDPNRGVYRTRDGGKSWEKVFFVDGETGAVDLAMASDNPRVLYAAAWRRTNGGDGGGPTSGIFRSTNGGDSWTRLANGLPTSNLGRIGLALSASQPKIIYALVHGVGGSGDGVYKSEDGGDHWRRLSSSPKDDIYDAFFGNIRVDPSNSDVVYALGLHIQRSIDGGVTWNVFGFTGDNHSLYIDPRDPKRLLLGCDPGFYVSHDGGSNWAASSLPNTQIYNIDLDPYHPDRLYGGSQDKGIMRNRSFGSPMWDLLQICDGFRTVVDPLSHDTSYSVCTYGLLIKSQDDGRNYDDKTPQGVERKNWNTPIAMDPISHILYYGGNRLMLSRDGAETWSAASQDLTNGGTISVILVNPKSPANVYVGTDDGHLWISRDRAKTWAAIDSGLPKANVTGIAASSADGNDIVVTLNAYAGRQNPQGYILRSSNGGKAWSDIDSNLPRSPINAVVADPANEATLFIATDAGVFTTSDFGARWLPLREGMPAVPVNSLALDASKRILYAGTYGRSAYALSLTRSDGEDKVSHRE